MITYNRNKYQNQESHDKSYNIGHIVSFNVPPNKTCQDLNVTTVVSFLQSVFSNSRRSVRSLSCRLSVISKHYVRTILFRSIAIPAIKTGAPVWMDKIMACVNAFSHFVLSTLLTLGVEKVKKASSALVSSRCMCLISGSTDSDLCVSLCFLGITSGKERACPNRLGFNSTKGLEDSSCSSQSKVDLILRSPYEGLALKQQALVLSEELKEMQKDRPARSGSALLDKNRRSLTEKRLFSATSPLRDYDMRSLSPAF